MKFIDNFKENRELRKQYNTKTVDLMVAQAENNRKDIIIQELEEVVSSVRKIWIDANNEKELEIVRLTEELNNLKRGGKSVSKSTNASTKVSRTKQDNNK